MKKLFLLLLLFFILFSCKKEREEEVDMFGEVIYTDSFSPKAWENPITREKIEAADKDIGMIIEKETIDPRLRNILTLIDNFVLFSSKRDFNRIKNILTSSAYNSFILRYPDVTFNKKYFIRVAYPEQIESERYWIQFKILFSAESIVSKIEVEKFGNNLKISDFENNYFTEIDRIF